MFTLQAPYPKKLQHCTFYVRVIYALNGTR